MPFNLGFGEILVVLVVALLVFGGRLPQVGNSLGRGLREFRKGLKGQVSPEEDDAPPEPEDVEEEEEEELTGEAASPDPSP